MPNEKNHIDNILSDFLSDATMDADGIDWSSFQSKRKRNRAMIWWMVAAGVAVIAVLSVLLGKQLSMEVPLSDKETSQPITQEKTTSSHNDNSSVVLEAQQRKHSDENAIQSSTTETKLSNTSKSEKSNKRIAEEQQAPLPYKPIPETEVKYEADSQLKQELFFVKPFGYPTLSYVLKYKFDSITDKIAMRAAEPDNSAQRTSNTFVKFGFGPSLVSPSLKLSTDARNFIHKDYGTIRNDGEQNAIGFHLTGMLGKRFNRWSPFLGLGFSYNSVAANYNFSYSEKPIRDIDGTILGYQNRMTENIKYSSHHTYAMVDIPIGTEFDLKQLGKSRISLVGQVSPQVLFSAQGDLPHAVFLNETDVLSTADFKLSSVTGYVGLTYSHRLSNMEWYVEPKYAYTAGFAQVKDLYNTKFSMIVVTFGIRK